MIRIGTAGWVIPRQHAASFPGDGSHLQRYAGRFSAVEINSSFYRPHRPATYARWAASVPAGFQFAVKVPRTITHERKMVDVVEPLERFLGEVHALGGALGPLLVQLPPSLAFDAVVAGEFFGLLRERFEGGVVCEPRHPSWFSDAADAVLLQCRVARVAADPAPVPRAAEPGGWPGIVYRRLHGSPRMYDSGYSAEYLDTVAQALREDLAHGRDCWCVFDNTALGEAAGDALGVLGRGMPPPSASPLPPP